MAALLGVLVSAHGVRADSAKPAVLVFLQIDAKSSAVEKTLREHLPNLSVTVFGRFRDFEDAITNGSADAILSIPPVTEGRGKPVTLEGQRGGKNAEPYVLASVNQPLSSSLAGKTIGAVDLLGREGTQSFVSGLLKSSDFKLKRVAKVEDLLPLLEFSAADGVVLPASMLKRLMDRTRLPIKTRELPGAVGLPVVVVLNPGARDTVVKSFQSLDGPTKALLGIDLWSVR